MNRRSDNRLWAHIDWLLVFIYLALVVIGWVNIYASIHSTAPDSIFDWGCRSGKQFVWIITAFILAATILLFIHPKLFELTAPAVYGFVTMLLVAVIFLSADTKGSHSWFAFGPVKFQPAEISKISTSLLLAYILSRYERGPASLKDWLKVGFFILLPMLIIVAESETGSALVYAGFIFMLYREGLSGWWIALLGAVIAIFILSLRFSVYTAVLPLCWCTSALSSYSGKRGRLWWTGHFPILLFFTALPWLLKLLQGIPALEGSFVMALNPLWFLLAAIVPCLGTAAWRCFRRKDSSTLLCILALIAGIMMAFSTRFVFDNILKDHQKSRIELLLGMRDDPKGVGYNVNQSMIAIGSGGLFGKGFLKGTQTTFGFVPEQSTDFIFCTVGEEWGFAGSVFVILLYALLIWRVLTRSEHAATTFTRVYGYCTACCFFMHLFINIGMTIGLMPVIGIPLPLVSYGGSSLWAFTVLLFIFIALDAHERKY